ncbi:MAG: hypothetical protein EOO45_28490 [Flavobacterium sp.]|nr:MAG: hypothetical protein EOO45_28490 [Flavobacterium sp.]
MYTKYIVIIALFATACSIKQEQQQLDKAPFVVEPVIKQNPVYKLLDQQKDFQEIPVPEGDSVILDARTSYVKYSRDDFNKDTSWHRTYNCRSIIKNDTLMVRIGIGNLFTSTGFLMKCNNGQFNILPFYSTDVVVENPPQPKFKVIYQQLTLDKNSYALGDSLYGNVQFKIIEHINGETITHLADGYFRSKVKKDWWD